MKHRSPLRRKLLASLALCTLCAPALSSGASGCAAGFPPISQVSGLRVLGVVADKPYAKPGDQVTFTMTYDDATADVGAGAGAPRPVQIFWLAGCYDPAGDEYYGCYSQLASVFADPENPPPGTVGLGQSFSLALPSDIISRRPQPTNGDPYYGIAIVFFAACAGTIQPVAPQGEGAGGSGAAGSFPLGCFDANGVQLGADSFVPGYAQVYAFADGRTNDNPVVTGLTINGMPMPEGVAGAVQVAGCSVPEDTRNSAGGCGKTDPFKACPEFQMSVTVPDDVAEVDPSGMAQGGGPLYETVWVDYFADNGDIDSPVLLVSASAPATPGGSPLQSSFSTNWIAPPSAAPDAGPLPPVKFWAVVHDSRGGETVIERYLQVE
jgi:hypothetical protein